MNKFSKFQLRDEEEKGVELEGKDVSRWREECERSLLGKIWGSKKANFPGLKATIN